jgi:HAD superfamily hydrolase (TIGR01549 family)
MLRAILFDLGDTLIDFEPMDTRAVFRQAAAATYQFLRDRGHVLPEFDVYCRRQFRAVRWAYFWAKVRSREFNSLHLLRRFCAEMGIELDEAPLLELAWLWYAPLTEHSSSEEDLYATLAGLRRAGYKMGLVSNTFVAGPVHDRHLELHGLLEFFPVRVYSSDTGYRKPDRRIFHIALARMGVRAEEALFVGDLVKTDVVGARNVGMKTVLKQPWGTAPRHGLADCVIRQVSDLPGVLDKFQGESPSRRRCPEYVDSLVESPALELASSLK